jgi:hypothetical protein
MSNIKRAALALNLCRRSERHFLAVGETDRVTVAILHLVPASLWLMLGNIVAATVTKEVRK